MVARADGVVVSDYVDVMTESGVRCPAKEAGLNVGDIIKQLNSQKNQWFKRHKKYFEIQL